MNVKTVEMNINRPDGTLLKIYCFSKSHFDSNKIFLDFHGGGYAHGSPFMDRGLLTDVGDPLGYKIVSVDYRMTPEHSIEQAIEDALIAYDFVVEKSGAKDIIFTGCSAGAGLATLLAMRLLKEKRELPKGIILLSPWLDLTLSTESIEKNESLDTLSKATMLYFQTLLLRSGSDLGRGSPFLAPIEDLIGLPPIYIDFSYDEILADEVIGFYQKALKAKVPIKMFALPGFFHGYQVLGDLFPEGKQVVERLRDWIKGLK